MIPLKKHLVGYNSNTFLQDAVAGLVVGMVTIPQAIAYALLAGVPAQAGLYACLLPMILYALLGSSKHLVVGPVAIAAVMIVSTVSEFAPKYSAEYLSITQAICIEVAASFVILRLARLGSLTNLVSHPVLTGFVNGAVLLIIISQIPALIGTENSSSLSAIDLLQILTAQDNQFDWISLFLGLAAISFLIVYRWVLTKEDENPRQTKSFSTPLLVGLGPAILISSAIFFVYYLGDLKSLSTVGQIPQGLPTFLLPEIDSQLWISIFPSSFIIALVIYVESFSIATTLASREKMTIDAQQELIALSAANFGAGMTGAYPVAGSFSRSGVNYFSNARTPISSLICAVVIVVSLLFFNELFGLMPLTILAAIVIVSAIGLLDLPVMFENWNTHKLDTISGLATLVTVLLIGIEVGLILGILLSIAFFLKQVSDPSITVVGWLPGTEELRSQERYEVETHPNLMFVRIDENIFFGNANNLEIKMIEFANSKKSISQFVVVCSSVNRIDTSGLAMFSRLSERLKGVNITLNLSDLKGSLEKNLDLKDLENGISGKIFRTAKETMAQLIEETNHR